VSTAPGARSRKRSRTPAQPAPATADRLTPEQAELGLVFRGVFRSLSRLRGRDTHLVGAELSQAQFELLGELDERGPLPAGELALAARLSPATVTQMLDHLAAGGHVERDRSETDRRVVLSRLTAQGHERIEAKRAAWQLRWKAALDGFDAADLRAATSVLERLGAMFDEVPAAAPDERVASGVQGRSRAPQ
jgi:DNA-binding MarR family transcriptional regulator